jgi:lysophospholipase L1-like esterase
MEEITVPTVVEFVSAGLNHKHLRAFVFPVDLPALPLQFSVESRAELGDGDGPDYQYSAYVDIYYADDSVLSETYLCFAPGRHDWQRLEMYLRPRLPIKRLVIYYFFEHKDGLVAYRNARIAPCELPPEPDCRIVLVGDSNTITSYLPPSQRVDGVLQRRLAAGFPGKRIEVENAGLGGESIKELLTRKRYERDLQTLGRADVFVISYAGNDANAYGPDEFERQQRELVRRLRTDFPAAKIILETTGYFDHPAHYTIDYNARMQPYTEATRRIAADGSDGGGADALLDIYQTMQQRTAAGDWDFRYRVHPQWKLTLDARYDAELGQSPAYYTNPHYNPRGTRLIADAIHDLVMQRGWI